MTDWKVKVKTKTGYVKDVIVYDYNYPSDAIEAALSQTGADDYITVDPHYEEEEVNRYYSKNTYSNRKPNVINTLSPASEFEFVVWLILGMIFVMISAPVAFVIFSIMTIRMAMSK